MAAKTLTGKNAIVTGSTSGIGLGIARALATEGANIVLNGFGNAAEIEKLRTDLALEMGVKVLFNGADMRKPPQIRAMVLDSEKELGSVDILVNNAGIQNVAPIEEFSDEKWDAIIAINLSSNFHTIKAAVPGMKARGFGRIVNLASVHGLIASPYKSAYVAAKHGVVGLTKTVALELAETNITCNAVCPGFVHTPLVDKQIEQQAEVNKMPRDRVVREVILASQPSKKFVELDQVAAFVLFICSPHASTMTGSIQTIDGGWTAR